MPVVDRFSFCFLLILHLDRFFFLFIYRYSLDTFSQTYFRVPDQATLPYLSEWSTNFLISKAETNFTNSDQVGCVMACRLQRVNVSASKSLDNPTLACRSLSRTGLLWAGMRENAG
jgi:hypothetical protein